MNTSIPSSYKQALRALSDRIVLAQMPIHILDAIQWDDEIQADFFKNNFKKLPKVDADYYQKRSLGFDVQSKIEEFYNLESDIRREAGQFSAISMIMQRICQEYREVVRMLDARGTKKFSKISQELYGSTNDAFYVNAPRLKDLAVLIDSVLVFIKKDELIDAIDEKIYTSEETAEILNQRLASYFGDSEPKVRVKVTDEIIADAAAGSEHIRVRHGMMFSERDIRILEVHEGWVHLGTTMNGAQQPICTFLSKGPPSVATTQEGLAIIIEIFNAASYPGRIQKLTNRIIAISMVEDGANFIDVFNFFREQSLSEDQSYKNTARIFRGSAPEMGPFTKDIVYSKGFILIYNYLRLAVQHGLASRIPLLFVGKARLRDQRMLANLVEEGLVVPPVYVPHPFNNLAAVSAWMCYSLFLNKLDLEQIAIDYRDILKG